MFDVLRKYKEDHGDCNVPSKWVENYLQLGQWVNTQRTNYRKDKLRDDRIKHLENIGFKWHADRSFLNEANEKRWIEKLETLKTYKDKHGDCNVPSNWKKNNINLGQWVMAQRYKYRNKELSENRVKQLEDIGFVWAIHRRYD